MKQKIAMWIAWHLPEYIVMWCACRVATQSTSGKWSNDGVPRVTMMDVIERWGQSNKYIEPTQK